MHCKLPIFQNVRIQDICLKRNQLCKMCTIYSSENIHAQQMNCFSVLMGDYLPRVQYLSLDSPRSLAP
jgi:hypothetical protein